MSSIVVMTSPTAKLVTSRVRVFSASGSLSFPSSLRSSPTSPALAETSVHSVAPGATPQTPALSSTPKLAPPRAYDYVKTPGTPGFASVYRRVAAARRRCRSTGFATTPPRFRHRRLADGGDLPVKFETPDSSPFDNSPFQPSTRSSVSRFDVIKRTNAFSLSVTPKHSPLEVSAQHKLYRLTGVALSPTSVSYAASSPVSSDENAGSRRSSPYDDRKRMHDIALQCPLGKCYFWMEDEAELLICSRIASGGFGHVFEGNYRGKSVAIKQLKIGCKSRDAIRESLQGEMHGMRLRHKNIIRTLVILQTPPKAYYVVMEKAGKYDLSRLINNEEEAIPPSRRYRFAGDILSGLAHLHSEHLLHLDLKPSNVVVTCDDVCQICDFGSCVQLGTSPTRKNSATGTRLLTNESCANYAALSGDSAMGTSSAMSSRISCKSPSPERALPSLLGTFIYRAPELLRGLIPTSKADVFSFSITAWQMWSRVLPYEGQHGHQTVFAVVAFGSRPEIPSCEECDDDRTASYFKLIRACWNADPCLRPSAESALDTIRHLLTSYSPDEMS